jgi:hypothetical protein
MRDMFNDREYDTISPDESGVSDNLPNHEWIEEFYRGAGKAHSEQLTSAASPQLEIRLLAMSASPSLPMLPYSNLQRSLLKDI